MIVFSPIPALTIALAIPATPCVALAPPKLTSINVAAADGTTTITIVGTASFVPRVSAKPGKKPVVLVPLVRTKVAANSIPVASREITRIDTAARGKSGISLTINAPTTLVWKISPDVKKQTWTIAFKAKQAALPTLAEAQTPTILPRRSPMQLEIGRAS